jgi:hypothetical protein
MESLLASAATDPAFSGFPSHESFGSLLLPDHPIRFGFQVDIVPSNCPSSILFGLISRDPVNGGCAKTTGFAVRLDLEMREVWDALNGSGLVGWVEHPRGLAGFTDEEPLLLGWEIEFHGKALIPKLRRRPAVALPGHPVPQSHRHGVHRRLEGRVGGRSTRGFPPSRPLA